MEVIPVSFGKAPPSVNSAFIKFVGAFGGDVLSTVEFLIQRNCESKSSPCSKEKEELTVGTGKHLVTKVYDVIDSFVSNHKLTSRSAAIEMLILGSGIEWTNAGSIKLISKTRSYILDKLNQDRLENRLCDLEIFIGNSGSIFAHKCILSAASNYFANLLQRHTRTITIQNLARPEVFSLILEFIYTGAITISSRMSLEIVKMARFLRLTALEKICKDYFTLSGQLFGETESNSDFAVLLDDTSVPEQSSEASSNAFYNSKLLSDDEEIIRKEAEFTRVVPPKQTNGGKSKEERGKTHPCQICHRSFQTKTYLKRHMISHTGERKHCCTTCGKLFLKADHLTRHELTHSSQRPFSCNKCEKTFKTKDNLKRHLLTHSEEKPFFCEICAKQFKDKAGLLIHQKSHSKTASVCPHCGKRFTQQNRLAYHIIRHTNPLTCEICGKTFAFQNHLRRHTMMHTGVRPFSCDSCGRQFINAHGLMLHRKKHTGVGLHTCPQCDRKFLDGFHLKRHMKMHTGEKPYRCDLCEKSFSRADNCESHKKTCMVKSAIQKDMQSFTDQGVLGNNNLRVKKVNACKVLQGLTQSSNQEPQSGMVHNIAIAVSAEEVKNCRYTRVAKRPPELKLILLKKDEGTDYLGDQST